MTGDPRDELETAPKIARKIELPALTGLRFVAAFSILFMHATEWCTPFRGGGGFFQTIAAVVGIYGMPLFFVLSGFVIHYNYGPRFRDLSYGEALREFFAARFARLYPLYIFFFVFGSLSDFTANWLAGYANDLLAYVLYSITMTQSWVYVIVVNHRMVLENGFGLGWSVSTEFFFYVVYAIFVFLILSVRRPLTCIIVAALFSAAAISVLLLAYLHADRLMDIARAQVPDFIDARDDFNDSFYRWFFYYSPYVRIAEFALGCLTAQLFLALRDRPVGAAERRWGQYALGAALCLLLWYGARYGMQVPHSRLQGLVNFFSLNFGCAVPIAVLIFCVARYRSPIEALLSSPRLVRLGDISYSIYAVHTWTLRPFVRPEVDFNAAFAVDAVLRIAFGIVFTLICATATYRLIEIPCRRYLRVKLIGSPAAPPLAPSVETA
ncbi:MAG TPA: acyltransferase [Stellaceae bacterium]|jgi:peptidoglycan/LPS O-acetylase OafA/YrhL|nr:acyltransferase [Stellaceae bacterium]